MDSERDLRELLEWLGHFDLDALLKEITIDLDAFLKEIIEAPVPFIDFEPQPRKPRKTRTKKTPDTLKKT